MRKTSILVAAAFTLVLLTRLSLAQTIREVLYLSEAEAAEARKAVETFQAAQDRSNRAGISWRSFHQGYQAAHPELPSLKFSSDFRVAFTITRRGELGEAVTVELSPEERQQAESRHGEMVEAEAALKQARESWHDFQYELLARRFPDAETRVGNVPRILTGGQKVAVPMEWQSGFALTSDFRLAVPR
jgi:hypothetical protein